MTLTKDVPGFSTSGLTPDGICTPVVDNTGAVKWQTAYVSGNIFYSQKSYIQCLFIQEMYQGTDL
jgi:hypothetical protein